MIMREYFNAGTEKWLPDFFAACLKTYAESGKARQNLLYHYAYSLHELGDEEKAAAKAKDAKAEFVKNGDLTAEIEENLDLFAK